MKDLQTYIMEAEQQVFAVQDVTGAILNVFPDKKSAEDDLKNWPKESEAKVVTMKKGDIEK